MARKTYSFDLLCGDVKVTSFPIYMRGFKASIQDYNFARSLAFDYARTCSKTFGFIDLKFGNLVLAQFCEGKCFSAHPERYEEVENFLGVDYSIPV